MKKIVILSLLAIFATSSFAIKAKKGAVVAPETPKPVTLTDSISYALGVDVGTNLSQNLKQFNINVNWDFVKLGLIETVTDKNQFSMEQLQAIFGKLNALVAENQRAKTAEQKVFLEKNKNVEGVMSTSSGLQYKVLKLGQGAKPAATDHVKVHYHGTLIDGTVFDSSVQRGEPVTFPLNGVIPGWTEGVQLMPLGSKFVFYIPSELGYGEQGAGGVIPPGATLIFEVELLEINPK